MSWYSYLYAIGSLISQPFSNLYYQFGEEAPLLGALLLGVVGAFAPCQLSGNVAAFTIMGKDLVDRNRYGKNVILLWFLLGQNPNQVKWRFIVDVTKTSLTR